MQTKPKVRATLKQVCEFCSLRFVRRILMAQDSVKYMIHLFAFSAALIAGCAEPPSKVASPSPTQSPQPNIETVAQTLKTYQVGRTSIEDFIRDAGLINTTFPSQSNSEPRPPVLYSSFRTTTGSPWKIYETSFAQGQAFGRVTQTRKYVVGDIKRPICILAFGNEGKLTSIAPVTDPAAFPAESIAQKQDGKAVPHPAKPVQSLEVVAQTLKTYQVGKTTMEDFIRDADLVKTTNSLFPPSYLNPHPIPDFLAGNILNTRTGSPWRIYKFHVENGKIKEGAGVTPIQQYLVGDVEKPICFLTFDNKGKLTNISPPP